MIFDWSEAPDATPRTMVLQLFELDGSHYNRYEFGSTKGGIIRVRAGAYRMLFHNGDMENMVESGSRYEEYEVMTVDRELLAPIGRASEAPRPGDAETQPVRFAPEPMWAGNSGAGGVGPRCEGSLGDARSPAGHDDLYGGDPQRRKPADGSPISAVH